MGNLSLAISTASPDQAKRFLLLQWLRSKPAAAAEGKFAPCEVLKEAEKQGVWLFLWKSHPGFFKTHFEAEEWKEWDSRVRARQTSQARATAEAIRLCEGLEQKGVPVLLFKGPVLSFLSYGDISLRPFKDLDLLVPKDKVEEALAWLKIDGYEVSPSMIPGRKKAWLKSGYDFQLTHRRGGPRLELHWDFFLQMHDFPLSPELAFREKAAINLLGRRVNTLSREHLFLFLAHHGTKHFWYRLEWLFAMHRLLDFLSPETLLAKASRLRSEKVLLFTLALIGDFFERSYAPETTARIEKSGLEVERKKVIEHYLDGRPEPPFADTFSLQLKLMDRPSDRIKSIFKWVVTPSVEDWGTVSLPQTFFWLYYLLRPFRLFCKQLRIRKAARP